MSLVRLLTIVECSDIVNKMSRNVSKLATEYQSRTIAESFIQNKLYNYLRYLNSGLVTDGEYVSAVASEAKGIVPAFYFGNVPAEYMTKEFILRCIDAAKTSGRWPVHISMLPRHFLEDHEIQEAFLHVGVYDVTGIENLSEKTWKAVLKAQPEQIHNIKNRTPEMVQYALSYSSPSPSVSSSPSVREG